MIEVAMTIVMIAMTTALSDQPFVSFYANSSQTLVKTNSWSAMEACDYQTKRSRRIVASITAPSKIVAFRTIAQLGSDIGSSAQYLVSQTLLVDHLKCANCRLIRLWVWRRARTMLRLSSDAIAVRTWNNAPIAPTNKMMDMKASRTNVPR
jgi:hypothetical protein